MSNKSLMDRLNELGSSKEELNLTWVDIRDILNEEFNHSFDESTYRKRYNLALEEKFSNTYINDYADKTFKRDIANEKNSWIRRLSREESLRAMAHDAAETITSSFGLTFPKGEIDSNEEYKAILTLSDWHYGCEVDSFFNKFNKDVALDRINKLQVETIKVCKNHGVKDLYVVNLGDLISGRIHRQLRISNQMDIIHQTMDVAEILAEFLNNLSFFFNIHYCDTLDNHSRIEPVKEESLELESMVLIITWFLRERLKDNKHIKFYENTFANDIANFNVLGHNVVAVHGHKDKPERAIENLTMMTKNHYDIVLTAHFHHFSCDEQHDTVRVSNGSLMGLDDYAQNLRLNSAPSQNLIIVSKENPCYAIYKINLR